MPKLTLKPGPSLRVHRYTTEDNIEGVEVNDRAHEFLFCNVAVDPAVTLNDFFELLRLSPLLKDIYRQDFAHELSAEAEEGFEPDPNERGLEEHLEALVLSQMWNLDTSTNTYSPISHLSLTGESPILLVDSPDYFCKAGERIQWGVSSAGLRSMLLCRVRVDNKIRVCEEDIYSKGYMRELSVANIKGFTLGQLLEGLLWELSFHGTPEDTRKVFDELSERVTDIESNPDKWVSSADDEDCFLSKFDRPGLAAMFETLGEVKPAKVASGLRTIEDGDNASEGIALLFGKSVVVKPEFRDLNGRAFRKAFGSV
jgi:hypothetical protein